MNESTNIDPMDLEAQVDANPSSEADAPAPKAKAKAKAPAKKGAAKKGAAKKEPTAKQLQAAADKAAKAEEKAAAKKIADAKKAAEAKEKAEKALVVKTEKGMKPLINRGLKAMHMVGNGNKEWTIAAYEVRKLCAGTPVNFKDAMHEGWGVAKNTATKLANAGQLMHELTTSENQDVQAQLEYMPMGSINNLSVISGFSEKKLEVGIDKGFIKMDATEAEVAEFNRDYDDKGKKRVVKTIPSTPQADAEDAAKEAGVSESETAAPVTFAEKLAQIVALTDGMSTEQVNEVLDAIEAKHDIASS